MKRIIGYLKSFWITIFLITLSIIFWYYLPENYSNFRQNLLASILGVGIAIFAAEGSNKIKNHRRIKKTFGLLKLIIIPYLRNQSQSFIDTTILYQDICERIKAVSFVALIANLNEMGNTFDKTWLQMVFSQHFLDAIHSDDHFNKISHTILELLAFINTLTVLSANAKTYMMNNHSNLNEQEITLFISKAHEFRDILNKSAHDLQKYVDQLDQEVDSFFTKYNVGYKEIGS